MSASASAVVEAAACELRRKHPGWGPRRIAHVLEQSAAVSPVPSVRVQRRVSTVGTVVVCRQTVLLGRPYAGQAVTVHVSDSTITVDLDGQVRVIRRTTDVPVRNVKANKPHGAP
ncbi:hypothetical protein ACFZAE_39875 [Streptomyces scabiei]|uniref:hypothetical protein n=1 Tax=Streptomyces scabiei TaxID=1930 RepID=UPI0036E3B610